MYGRSLPPLPKDSTTCTTRTGDIEQVTSATTTNNTSGSEDVSSESSFNFDMNEPRPFAQPRQFAQPRYNGASSSNSSWGENSWSDKAPPVRGSRTWTSEKNIRLPDTIEEDTASGISSVPPRSQLNILPAITLPPRSREEEYDSADEEYEYALFDCVCFEIYWSPFFARLCSNVFGMKLKHSSKKGTSAFGKKEPVREGRVAVAIRKLGSKANKKSIKVKKRMKEEWEERRPTWKYQDPHFQEMELELNRLRRQLEQQAAPGLHASPSLHEGQFPSSEPSSSYRDQRRFTIQ